MNRKRGSRLYRNEGVTLLRNFQVNLKYVTDFYYLHDQSQILTIKPGKMAKPIALEGSMGFFDCAKSLIWSHLTDLNC